MGEYYLGLDIGTDSIGYAAADKQYELLRFHGSDAWGSVLFEAGKLSQERRGFRCARRRAERKKERIKLLQEIFAEEIAKVDPRFFIRLSESYRWRDETDDRYIFFNDENYDDRQYLKQYPTIHHLLCALMDSRAPHDVRLVYLACAWLIAHRGHFLNNLNVDRLEEITDIGNVYARCMAYFEENGYASPWPSIDVAQLGQVLKKQAGITQKTKELIGVLYGTNKPDKYVTEEFPFSRDGIVRLLAGGQYKVKDLYGKEEYADLGSFSLGMEEEKFAELMSNLGDDYEMINVLRGLYDWGVLAHILDDGGKTSTISGAKVAVYEQHKTDLAKLKYFIRKYVPDRYEDMFRSALPNNYVAYTYHVEKKNAAQINRKANTEDFSKYVLSVIKGIKPEEGDQIAFQEMIDRLDKRTFMPKQKNTDNRVIPHQLYEYELRRILENAAVYLPFLREKDADGVTDEQKICSLFTFKIPYYVGPLNNHSEHAWISRKAGRVLPWNYHEMVDEDASEESFIKRMTNQCSYLPGEPVMPKDSLCYQKFMVLNEINNLRIDGRKIPVDVKQGIYTELFEKKKRVSRKDIENFLISNGYLKKGEGEKITGIDTQIKSGLSSHFAFRNLMKNKILSENDVERIIERASYAEDKGRVEKWLSREYTFLSKEDRKYICSIKIKDFGRLSRKFLTELEGAEKSTGEITTILRTMWETNDNLMEILSDRYTFSEEIRSETESYYAANAMSLENRLDEMRVSNAVRRPIYRTLAIVKDLEKAFGKPKKIFVETTRGSSPAQKGKRTKTRKEQILEFYSKCRNEEVYDLMHELEKMGEYADNKLQADRLFLYFMQLGKCAYSGESIVLEKLMTGSKEYDIDHIYPQAYVKDDSILNNKVLVLSKLNGEKTDVYPIKAEIRSRMQNTWKYWHDMGLISDEKYKRLTRATPFTQDEKYGFINRQLTETSQSTKVVAQLLKEKYPEAEIVYSKAGLVSDFRHEFDLPKSRIYNDLHHAADAYLNIVVGNVYSMKFSKRWFRADADYSIKTRTVFTHPFVHGDEVVWNGENMLATVKKTARKNTAHFVKYPVFKTGGLFDQMPVKKDVGLILLKAGKDTARYGGYNKPGIMFFIPVRYKKGKKTESMIMPVELMHGRKFMEDPKFAKAYAVERLKKILGKEVDEVSFPMGMRPWKINTVLSLDGFRICIAGNSGGGKQLVAQSAMQFSSDEVWRAYIKKLEKFTEKRQNSKLLYDEVYDGVSVTKNRELYDLYIDKMQNSIYRKRVNVPLQILLEGKDKFEALEIEKQCETLLTIHSVFGRLSGGCDLSAIGGKSHSAATLISSTVSNWKKNYKDIRIIDQSPSGLWERRSENLLECL